MYNKLEGLMVEKQKNRKSLAKDLEISYNTLLLKLSHKTCFTIDEAFKIKNILQTNLTLEELFNENESA